MKIYFVRHAESTANKNHTDNRSPETPLSKYGLRQAELVAKRLLGVEIDFVCSSPHLRAKQTAEIISEKIGKPVKYWNQIIESDSSEKKFNKLNSRVTKILKEFISYPAKSSFICVSHATTIEAIIAKMVFGRKLSSQIMNAIKKHFGTANTGVSICELTKKDGWMLDTFNDSSHL